MKRISSTIVSIGLLATLAAACEKKDEKADWSVVCTVDASKGVGTDHLPPPTAAEKKLRRVTDENCGDLKNPDPNRGGFYYPMWIASGYRAPAVGELLIPGSYVGVKPGAGTIGKAPETGGFGKAG